MAISDWGYVRPNPNPKKYEEVWDNKHTGERMFLLKRKSGFYTVSIDGRKPQSFKYKSTAMSYIKSYQASN